MIKRLGVALVVLLLFGACPRSQVDPEAEIDLSGQVLREDGSSATGVRVLLARGPDAIEVIGTIASAGFFCLYEDFPSACDGVRRADTDDDGGFTFRLRGRDTQGMLGQASTMEAATVLPRTGDQLDGPGTTVRFMVQTEQMNLPIRVWEPNVTAQGDGRQFAVHWDRHPDGVMPAAADLSRMTTRLRFEQSEGAVVWEVAPARADQTFDARLLEDTRGNLSVYATIRAVEVSAAEGTAIDVLLRSGRYAYAGQAGAPVSRGAPCFVNAADGSAAEQRPCRLTDGEFGARFEPQTIPDECPPGTDPAVCDEPPHALTWLDLGEPTEITLVTVRGCPDRCLVDVSLDGEGWHPLGASEADEEGAVVPVGNFAVAPDVPLQARYVRVTADGGVEGLREISVWDASELPTVEPVSILLAPDELAPEEGGRPDSPSFPWAFVVAALALAAAGIALFFTRRYRRGRSGGSG